MVRLTVDRLRELLNYDPATGVFRWRARTSVKSRVEIGSVAGCVGNGYRFIQVEGTLYLEHRLAWLYVYGEWPSRGIDHKDTVQHHNWIDNLRLATMSQNMQNQRKAHANNRSGYLGVSWNKASRRWEAYIKLNYKNKNLGQFHSAQAAHEAYLAAKATRHPFSTIGPRAP